MSLFMSHGVSVWFSISRGIVIFHHGRPLLQAGVSAPMGINIPRLPMMTDAMMSDLFPPLDLPYSPRLGVLARDCGFPHVPQAGDVFLTNNGKDKLGRSRPCCFEYTAPCPDGTRIARLPDNYNFVALETKCVLLPAANTSPFTACWGIAIRTESSIDPTCHVWVNVSRGRVKFARLRRRASAVPFADQPAREVIVIPDDDAPTEEPTAS